MFHQSKSCCRFSPAEVRGFFAAFSNSANAMMSEPFRGLESAAQKENQRTVKDAIRCLCDVQRMLKRAAKQHAVKTGNAKGGSTWRKDAEQLFDKEVEL